MRGPGPGQEVLALEPPGDPIPVLPADTVRSFMKRSKLGPYNEELQAQQEAKAAQRLSEEKAQASAISVGSRCEVRAPGQSVRRGTVMYVGTCLCGSTQGKRPTALWRLRSRDGGGRTRCLWRPPPKPSLGPFLLVLGCQGCPARPGAEAGRQASEEAAIFVREGGLTACLLHRTHGFQARVLGWCPV